MFSGLVESMHVAYVGGLDGLTSIVMASVSCLPPLFLLDFSFCSFDCLGEDVEGTSDTMDISPFVSVVAATVEAVDLRGILWNFAIDSRV